VPDPERATSHLLGVETRGSRALGGAAFEVELADGRTVVAKRGAGAGAAPAEATGLRWLAGAGGAAVPEMYAYDDDWLVTGTVGPGSPSEDAAERLGRGLAATHAAGAPAFGSPPPGGPTEAWIGLTGMRNVEGESWPEWYAAHRVEPYLRAAVDAGRLRDGDAAVLRRVCERIGELSGPEEPPSRLHGDLWNGNVLFATGGAVLIDPAAHGGHRETDLAMLALFGCPHLDRILACYDEAHPLAPGWRDRVPLHQLFPLLVHTVLFGAAYADSATAAARRALATLA
jgi:fructosamine-3-kinase